MNLHHGVRSLCFFVMLLAAHRSSAQIVYPCDHRYGAVASWSQCTDVLVPSTRYDAELWGFKYNLALTVFDSPFSITVTTDKSECSQTGRLSWEVYFQIDRWVNPDGWEYPKDYKYYSEKDYPYIPDYFLKEWTEVGQHYFPDVTVGAVKPYKYPNHGQQLYDLSGGRYGYNWQNGRSGEIDVVSDLIVYHREWVKQISGRYPSCFSYRMGEIGVRYAMEKWFIAGRNSAFNASGKSRTSYGVSKITGKYLGYPDRFNYTADEAICQPSSTRYWDCWNTKLSSQAFETRIEGIAYCESVLEKTLENHGWYNDFTHWHDTCKDDLEVFFASQRFAIGDAFVFTGGYGECMQHRFLRDSVDNITTRWEGNTCIIEVHESNWIGGLPIEVFSIPLSVQVDLSGTALAGNDITSNDSPGIRKIAPNLFSVDVPFTAQGNFLPVHIAPTTTPHYLDFVRPNFLSITAADRILTVETDKPVRLALFWTKRDEPEYETVILCRCNDLATKHVIDFNDTALLTYGGKRSWTDVETGDIYIGAITETKQSTLSNVYHYGEEYVSVESPSLPLRFTLSQNYPNPFNSSTTLRYEIPEEERVAIRVYSILGQEIRTLLDETVPPGVHTAIWDGRDDRGGDVSSGVYICSVQAGGKNMVRKLVLMK
ncbi:T9SS type A sorting domain-containing protein [bacterium]|nr:T9SS type A sorting domain-containing protein [bacterium]